MNITPNMIFGGTLAFLVFLNLILFAAGFYPMEVFWILILVFYIITRIILRYSNNPNNKKLNKRKTKKSKK